jgi:cobalt-zinc-cadmium efflux system outer membrane protein
MHRFRFLHAAVALLAAGWPVGVRAQRPVTRQDVVNAALAQGTRLALGRADSAAIRADERVARALPNPALSAAYTKSLPRYHAVLDLPLDWPWLRAPRVGAAAAASAAAGYRLAFERAAVRFDAETTYARALAAAAHARLSRRTAEDADSLLRMATLRRDAGDASELDVRLATINLGQLTNQAADDSLATLVALLDVQQVMGLPSDHPLVTLSDSLALPVPDSAPSTGEPLLLAAAGASLHSAERALRFERTSALPAPSLQVGVENGDPTGAEPGLLPTIGVAFSLPLFNQNGGAIARASAMRDRAAAELTLARRESDAAIAQTRRALALALAKARRDARLVGDAESVTAMFLVAYAEGTASLPEVLEAQRNARQVLARYVDDLVAAVVADGAVRLLTASAGSL